MKQQARRIERVTIKLDFKDAVLLYIIADLIASGVPEQATGRREKALCKKIAKGLVDPVTKGFT